MIELQQCTRHDGGWHSTPAVCDGCRRVELKVLSQVSQIAPKKTGRKGKKERTKYNRKQIEPNQINVEISKTRTEIKNGVWRGITGLANCPKQRSGKPLAEGQVNGAGAVEVARAVYIIAHRWPALLPLAGAAGASPDWVIVLPLKIKAFQSHVTQSSRAPAARMRDCDAIWPRTLTGKKMGRAAWTIQLNQDNCFVDHRHRVGSVTMQTGHEVRIPSDDGCSIP